jgi:hypothetical protein
MSTTLYAVGARFCGPNDILLWIESQRTVIAGDTLVDLKASSAWRPSTSSSKRLSFSGAKTLMVTRLPGWFQNS